MLETIAPETAPSSKSIFASKTFWLNAISTAALVSGALPPNKYTVAAVGVLNIANRFLTSDSVHVVAPPKDES